MDFLLNLILRRNKHKMRKKEIGQERQKKELKQEKVWIEFTNMKQETEYLNRIFGKNSYFEIYHTNINKHCVDDDNQKSLSAFDKSGHY